MSTWSRPSTESRWHAVVEIQPTGSVRTRCFGRWPTSLERDEHDNPPITDRCRACLAATVNAPAVSFAWDMSDVQGSD